MLDMGGFYGSPDRHAGRGVGIRIGWPQDKRLATETCRKRYNRESEAARARGGVYARATRLGPAGGGRSRQAGHPVPALRSATRASHLWPQVLHRHQSF